MAKDDKTSNAAVATVEDSTAVAAPAPSFMIETNQEDMMIPFLKVVQQLSDECTSGKDKYDAKVKAGDVYDGVTRSVYTGSSIIVCGIKKYFSEWTPEIRGKLVAKHEVNSDIVVNAIKTEKTSDKGNTYFQLSTKEGNILTETYGVACLVKTNGIALPAVFTLAKTSFMAGKSLNTLLVMHQQMGVPLFKFETSVTSNSKGSWYKPVFTFDSYETDEKIIAMAKSFSAVAGNALFKIHADEQPDSAAIDNDVV